MKNSVFNVIISLNLYKQITSWLFDHKVNSPLRTACSSTRILPINNSLFVYDPTQLNKYKMEILLLPIHQFAFVFKEKGKTRFPITSVHVCMFRHPFQLLFSSFFPPKQKQQTGPARQAAHLGQKKCSFWHKQISIMAWWIPPLSGSSYSSSPVLSRRHLQGGH